MTRAKLVYQTTDKEYEFIGYEVEAKSRGIIFRSSENSKSIVVGDTRFILDQLYYCSEVWAKMDGKLFVYWTPVYKADIDVAEIFKELVYLTSEKAPNNTGFYQ